MLTVSFSPRTFDDQSAIFGDQMSGTWSGAIIYEWIEEANNYGLISYGPSAAPTATAAGVVGGFTRSGTPTPISPDFSNLSNQWATLTPSAVSMNAYSPSNSPPACPAFTSGLWMVQGDVSLPTLGATFDAAASSSITAGGSSATGSATTTGTGSKTGSATASGASTSASKAAAGSIILGRNPAGWNWWSNHLDIVAPIVAALSFPILMAVFV